MNYRFERDKKAVANGDSSISERGKQNLISSNRKSEQSATASESSAWRRSW